MPLEGRQNVRQAKGSAAKKAARQSNAALRRGAGMSVRRPGKGNTMAQTGGEKGIGSGYSKLNKPPMRGGSATRPKANVGGKPATRGRSPGGGRGDARGAGGRGRRPGGGASATQGHPFRAGHPGRGKTGGLGYGAGPKMPGETFQSLPGSNGLAVGYGPHSLMAGGGGFMGGGPLGQNAALLGGGQNQMGQMGPMTGGYGGAPGPQPGSATGGNPFQNMGNPLSNIMNPSQAMNGLGGMLGGKGGGGQASMRQGMNGGQRQAAGNPQNRMY